MRHLVPGAGRRRCENRTTIELISTTEPALSARAAVNSLVRRSAATTFTSKLSATAASRSEAWMLPAR
jgi:hypothetical protein